MDKILIRGARTRSLKNVDLTPPRDKPIMIAGLPGPGRSSLTFDTLYAEDQRRYMESLSVYARQFLSMMEKPGVDATEGLPSTTSIEQKSTFHSPCSTVGMITRVYDYLRLLCARVGTPHHPDHDIPLEAQTASQMISQVLILPEGSRLTLLVLAIREREGEHPAAFDEMRVQGFARTWVDGKLYELDEVPKLDKQREHSIDVMMDRFKVRVDFQQCLTESFGTTLSLADGITLVAPMNEGEDVEETILSARFACSVCGHLTSGLKPKLFSFNNSAGACPTYDDLDMKQLFDAHWVINGRLTLTEGMIRNQDWRNVYYLRILSSLVQHYGLSLEESFDEPGVEYQKVVLYGSGRENIDSRHFSDRGDIVKRSYPFEGILSNLGRRHRETRSATVRRELTKFLSIQPCPDCHGTRLRRETRHAWVGDRALPAIAAMSVGEVCEYIAGFSLTGRRGETAVKILKKIRDRLQFLVNVGLDYLTLGCSADTSSDGEARCIHPINQTGAGLVGVMYILDEPLVGLHQYDNERPLGTLAYLRNFGNTMTAAKYDEDVIRFADYVVGIGLGAGVHDDQVVAKGMPDQVVNHPDLLVGRYLSGHKKIAVPVKRIPRDKKKLLKSKGTRGNNLQNVSLETPVGLFTCITGVSSSDKSTLINSTLFPITATALNGTTTLEVAPYDSFDGLQYLDKMADIDQSPIGRTPHPNPVIYTNLFMPIRELFFGTPEARSRGYGLSRFPFNVKGGHCEACQGDGMIKAEIHFLSDIYVPYDVCKGRRYGREVLEIRYRDKSIHEVLGMTVEEAREFFGAAPALARKLQTLMDVGLSYIELGQSATILSGGEAQRVKLSRELSERDADKTLHALDEPTAGLHPVDIQQSLDILHHLRGHGDTVVVIKHNLDAIEIAGWLVDLGPEGGPKGGQIIASGMLEQMAEAPQSYTGCFLRPLLEHDHA